MKYIFTLLLLLLSFQSVSADFISNSLAVKRVENISYDSNITLDGNGDSFEVRFNIIPNSSEPNRDFKVILSGLPANLTASGTTLNSDTCTSGIKDISQQNNTLTYIYTPNGGSPCNAILTATYTTNITPSGDYNLSYTILDITNSTLTTGNNSANLEVNNLLKINRANSIDADSDGFIERYDLSFNEDIWTNILLPANISVSDNDDSATNIVFTKTGDQTGTLSFDDGVFGSWDTPDIVITSQHNSFQATTYNLWVIQDTALAKLLTVNGLDNNGSIAFTTIPTSLILVFSEPVRETDIVWMDLTLASASVSGTKTLNSDQDTLTFTPSAALSNGSYSIVLWNSLIDIAGNTQSEAAIGVAISDGSSSGSSGSSGSSWSSGSSGSSSSGSSWSAWSIGSISPTPVTPVVNPDTEAVSGDATDSLTATGSIFIELKDVIISEITHPTLQRIALEYLETITPDDYLYYSQIDESITVEYNAYATTLYDFFTTVQQFIDTKDKSLKSQLIAQYSALQKLLKQDHELYTRYVSYEIYQDYSVYHPKEEKLKQTFIKIEAVIVEKFIKLYDSQTITQDEFNEALEQYNDFVLHFTLFKQFKSEIAKTQAIEALQAFAPTYRKKVKKNIVIEEITPEASEANPPQSPLVSEELWNNEDTSSTPKQTYGDKYYFDFELRKWAYNIDVSHLQEILAAEWYFNHAVTYYYGDVTTSSLKAFAKQELGLDISGEVFGSDLIERVLEREMKE